eukprot:GHVU01041807.1.p1 GENE.GHVU01041807.1~~GHVU01041807.1.p1  ORF type:complete len:777 (+),score=97.28 GHVU01041807.1:224-2332(+)
MGERIKRWAGPLARSKGQRIIVSLSFDATKVPPVEEISSAFNITVGGVHPDHKLPIDDERDPIPASKLATEVKCGLLSTQDVSDGLSPVKLIVARPQLTNQRCDAFNKAVVDAVKDSDCTRLASVACDGLSAESCFLRDGLIDFLLGSDGVVYLVDPNHVAKAIRSQVVLGSKVVTMGDSAVDPGLLMAAGVKKELYCVSDYASDGSVLQLCSLDTLQKLESIMPQEDAGSVVVTGLTLFFTRLLLVAVNAKHVIPAEERVTFMWCAMLWVTSLDGVHLATKRNLVASVLGAAMLCMQRQEVRLSTTEPLEHFFGTMRQHRREFSVKDLIERVGVLETAFKNVTQFNIRSSSSSKGYMAGFDDYAKAVGGMLRKQSNAANSSSADQSGPVEAGGVDVDYEGSVPVAKQIEQQFLDVVNGASMEMRRLLKQFGCVGMSPFCDPIADFGDLARKFFSYMPEPYREQSKHSALMSARPIADGGETDDDVEDEEQEIADGEDECEGLVHIIRSFQRNLCSQEVNPSLEESCDPPAAERGISDAVCSEEFNNIFRLPLDEVFGVHMFVLARQCLQGLHTSERGRNDSLRKANTLRGRWFATPAGEEDGETVASSNTSTFVLKRNDMFRLDAKRFRILSVYRKSYNKWRMCDSAESDSETIVHYVQTVRMLGRFFHVEASRGQSRYGLIRGDELKRATRIVSRTDENI